MRGLVYATLKQFEKCGLNGVVNLLAARLGVDACGRDGTVSQCVLDSCQRAVGGNHRKTQRVLGAMRVPLFGGIPAAVATL